MKIFTWLGSLLLACSVVHGQGLERLFQTSHKAQEVQNQCQPPSITTDNWDAVQQIWAESRLTGLAYNDSGWVSTETILSFANGSYSNSLQKSFAYSLSGKVLEEVSEYWTGAAWENDERWTYEYDANDSLIARTNFDWTASAWDTVDAETFVYAYNGSRLVQYESAVWDANSGIFEPESRERYTYGGTNEIDTVFIDNWVSGAWFNSSRFVDIVWFDFPTLLPSYFVTQVQSNGSFVNTLRTNNIFYGPFNNKDGYIETFNNGNWDSLRYTVTRYDSEGFLALNEGYTFDTTLQMHVRTFGTQITNTFDLDACRLEEITQSSTPTGYQNSQRRTFNAFGVSSAPPQVSTLDFRFFPNPVSNALHFQVESERPGQLNFAISDLAGNIVFEMEKWQTGSVLEGKIPLQLPAGIYLLQVSSDEGRVVKRIAVQ